MIISILKTTAIICGVIILISLLQFFISIHPPRFTSKLKPSDLSLPYENITLLTQDNKELRAWFIPSPSATSTIIIGHGYPFDKGNILPVVTFLYPRYHLLLYDHRYFGESKGAITSVGIHEVKDVEAAVRYIHTRLKGHKVALYGFSLSASAMLMSTAQVNAIIVDSPYANLELMVHHVYRIFGPLRYPFVVFTRFLSRLFFGVDPVKVSPADALKDRTIPVLLIHGEQDTQIPIENAYVLKQANPHIEVWIIPGVDHGEAYARFPQEYENHITQFLEKHMKE